MKEIRWHGRGGDGAFTAAKLLGLAASVYSGTFAQAFPSFGPERRGAPVLAFTKIDDKTITDHSQVYTCDCVAVLDATLIDTVDVLKGLKEDGVLVINSPKSTDYFKAQARFSGVKNLLTIDATSIALEQLNTPIVNTVMLGAVLGATGMVKLEAAEMAIDELMGKSLREKNKAAIRTAYNKTKEVC